MYSADWTRHHITLTDRALLEPAPPPLGSGFRSASRGIEWEPTRVVSVRRLVQVEEAAIFPPPPIFVTVVTPPPPELSLSGTLWTEQTFPPPWRGSSSRPWGRTPTGTWRDTSSPTSSPRAGRRAFPVLRVPMLGVPRTFLPWCQGVQQTSYSFFHSSVGPQRDVFSSILDRYFYWTTHFCIAMNDYLGVCVQHFLVFAMNSSVPALWTTLGRRQSYIGLFSIYTIIAKVRSLSMNISYAAAAARLRRAPEATRAPPQGAA